MKQYTRFFTIYMVIVMVFFGLTPQMSASAVEETGVTSVNKGLANHVVDGDMEDPTNNWLRWGQPVAWNKTQDEQFGGLYSTYINSTGVHAGIQEVDIPVEAGRSYTFSFRYKSTVGNVLPILGIGSSNSDYQQKYVSLASTNNTWQYYERDFIVPSDFVDDFRVRVSVLLGEAYIDDITIEQIPSLTIVRDGDFESLDTDSWSGWGGNTNWRKTNATAFEGVQSLEIGNAERIGGGVYQSHIPLEAEKTYRVSFRYKVKNGSLNVIIGDSDANSDVEGLPSYFWNTSGVWKEYTRVISGSVFNTSNVILRLSTRNGMAWVDDVHIEEILVVDGDMESDGLTNWENYARSITLEKTAATAQEGLQSLYAQTANTGSYNLGGAQYRYISVLPGETYTLSFQYKVNGSLVPRLGINDSNNDFELTEMDIVELDPTQEWASYTRTFTVPQDFVGDFRLVFRLQNWYVDGTEPVFYEGVWYDAPHHTFVGNGEMWIDDVSIVVGSGV
ncbi:carbohydrate binding domain-containing protein [Patescibacteria group bacterium]|nr:carbohydrate binding domain-containing protein [Patescibacteria group bacterium]MBU1722191.1 carbohydrate binding domain-containing protein [Patescibacteria group bacterium]MBU1901142.1 carbohydrate binding domain-containing protein [Patescibacteria group bacterium]